MQRNFHSFKKNKIFLTLIVLILEYFEVNNIKQLKKKQRVIVMWIKPEEILLTTFWLVNKIYIKCLFIYVFK